MISHELRTPLTGILNSLRVLQEGAVPEGFSQPELIDMAARNAERLHQTLAVLLDLAALDEGSFQVRLKEVDLGRVLSGRLDLFRAALAKKRIHVTLAQEGEAMAILADPQKLGRAFELAFSLVSGSATPGKTIEILLREREAEFRFEIESAHAEEWQKLFAEGERAPQSAFQAAHQSEQRFLSRPKEGLGSEFLLIHEIARRHQGSFRQQIRGASVHWIWNFPELSSEEALRNVLQSRAYRMASELGSVALALVAVPKGQEVGDLRRRLRDALFRSSDAVYALPASRRIALVMDDCKKEDAPHLLRRIEKEIGQKLTTGVVCCPEEGSDPEYLLELASSRLSHS